MSDAPSAKVIAFPTQVEKRAAQVRGYLAKRDPLLTITTVREALRYGDLWQAHANRLEAILMLVTAQRDASDLLLRLAEEELERLRKSPE